MGQETVHCILSELVQTKCSMGARIVDHRTEEKMVPQGNPCHGIAREEKFPLRKFDTLRGCAVTGS